ncbi:MAG: hypothetical protein ACREBD_38090, partial [Blastocatellia bacterium]
MNKTALRNSKYIPPALFITTFFVYYFSNKLSGSYYDYTFRIAGAFLHGQLGLTEQPPDWLNEMIPLDGRFYSAFPLGSILTMLPLALLKQFRIIESFPGVFLAALLAATASLLIYLLSAKYHDSPRRRLVLTLLPVFGTWMWANLAFAGAWHIALGFAVVGQLAALYFILIRYNPTLAGLFFALAFGNRTEIILLAPIFIFLIYKHAEANGANRWRAIDRFVAIPLALGVLTLIYN